ncbi:MAG: ribonuclease H-like domain-containing protein [Bacteroidales bacterium]|jgi:hypothetical protein|nr:ribonuclease H-like domain-containing protein [Bacteroidales bacterium]
MLDNINPYKTLFLDIETVPRWESYNSMPDNFKKLWDHKAQFIAGGKEQTSEELYERAGIYAEFGKIICISWAYFQNDVLVVKSFFGDDEKYVLEKFNDLCKEFPTAGTNMCAHNGKEFDFPYISRRMLINGYNIPEMLDTRTKKPWEVQLIDTMDLWKFGDYKSYTSLELLCALFEIPTPKDDINGSEVASVYWKEKDLPRIVRYCEKDVVSVAQLLLKYLRKPLLPTEKIKFSNA